MLVNQADESVFHVPGLTNSMEGLYGSRFIWTPALRSMSLAMLGYFVSAYLAAMFAFQTVWAAYVTGDNSLLASLGIPMAIAAVVACFVIMMRSIVRYAAWDRPRSRLGFAVEPYTKLAYRESTHFNWGLMGKSGERVLAHLNKITGHQATMTPDAQAEVVTMAKSLRRKFLFDMVWSLPLGLALGTAFAFMPIDGSLAFKFGLLYVLFSLLMPLSMYANAYRYQDIWLSWYVRHFKPSGQGGSGEAAPGQ